MERYILKTMLILLGLILIPLQADAQNRTITGKVSDQSGAELIGVNILLKGTITGTITDLNGAFSIAVPESSENPVLVISYIGFSTQEITVGESSSLDIVLKEAAEDLEEVVVIGYGIQKKIDLTGSVSNVNTEELKTVPLASIGQALQGRAAGVNITQNTGMPGEGVAVRIRGVGSINSSNSPLYIVDGVPTTDALNNIAVSDIESVSVLKDAASAAIYGSRANNGVVIITTRKGKTGKATVSFNTQTGVQFHGKLTEMVNKDQYVEIYNEAANNDNAFIESDILKRALIPSDYAATLPDVNYLEEIFRKAVIQNHNLSVSGGNDRTSFLLSANYFNQGGIILNSGYERTSGKVSISSKAMDWLTVGTNLNFSRDENQIVGSSGDGYGGNGGSIVRYAFFRTPAIPIYDENNDFVDLPDYPGFFGDGYNPVGLAVYQDNIRKGNRLFGDFNSIIRFGEKLNLVTTLGFDQNNYNQRRFDRNWGTNDRINNPNTLTVYNGEVFNWTLSNALNYSMTVNDSHHISLMLGNEMIRNEQYVSVASEKDYSDQDVNLVFLGNGQGSIVVTEAMEAYVLSSVFARINYDYNGKYLISAVIREDGSSRFIKDNRWGTFYSVSAGWRIDREEFMESLKQVNLMKFRLSYGLNGNQEIGNYAYSDIIATNYNYPFGGVSLDGYALSVYGNKDVQWETARQFDAGLDINAFNNRVNFTVDYYYKITDNMLTRIPVPPSGGSISAAWVNMGKVLNTGLDFELGYKQSIPNGTINVTALFSTLYNEVLELPSSISAGRIDNGVFATLTEVGYPIGSFYLYEMEGIFQNKVDIITHAYQGDDIQPGDIKYKDQNSDGKITEADRVHVGSAQPDFTYGLNLSANYKSFDFTLLAQGTYGNMIYYQVATDIEGFYRPFTVTRRYYDERWTGEGTSNTQPRASWSAKSNNTKPSTRFLEDGSYLRIKTLQVGYTVPEALSKKISLANARVYLTAQNLLTITSYPGLDPEMTVSNNSSSEGDLAAGIDWGTYPSAISLSAGLQITF